MILIDTSILIDYFRKSNKKDSSLASLLIKTEKCFVSQITYFEILRGANIEQITFWNTLFEQFEILDFDSKCTNSAIEIYKKLKQNNKLIDLADLLIAATAVANNLPISTLNLKDFEKIESLEIIKPYPI